jgi:hypothetical protein
MKQDAYQSSDAAFFATIGNEIEEECKHEWDTDEQGEFCIKCYQRRDNPLNKE